MTPEISINKPVSAKVINLSPKERCIIFGGDKGNLLSNRVIEYDGDEGLSLAEQHIPIMTESLGLFEDIRVPIEKATIEDNSQKKTYLAFPVGAINLTQAAHLANKTLQEAGIQEIPEIPDVPRVPDWMK
jgi:hypothetical protein